MQQATSQTIRRLHSEGLALGKLGKHKEAIAKFEKVIKIDERNNYAWHRKGIELNSLKKYRDALDCFEKAIVIRRDDRYAWNHRAVALRELGQPSEALQSCNEAIKINGRYAFGWYTKGSILQHLGDIAGAKNCFRKAAGLAPDNDSYRERLAGINELSRESETADPTSAQLHQKGITHQKLGEHEQAIVCFDKAIRISESDHTAWHRKGISLNALERYDEAMECLDTAIRINSRDKFAWNHRAVSLCRLGNHRDAIVSCNEAIKIDDTYPFAWCNRAVIAAHLADFKEFEYSYRRARQLDPKGLLNQFLAENLPDPPERVPDRKGDIELFVYYCCDLCLVHLKAQEIHQTLKYALDLNKYANERVKAILTPLIQELEFRTGSGIVVTDDLIERAGVTLHKAQMQW